MSGHGLARTVILLASMALSLSAACSRPPPTPEDEIRQLIADLEDAVREKNIAKLKGHVSEHYLDAKQRTKQDIKGILAYYFLQNRSIHLLTRVQSVRFPEPDLAEITVFAAMAGTKIPDATLLPKIDADLYRFDATLKKESDETWRLQEASWHPATTEDFG